jgi:Domain of unknown function (DUF5710)
MSQNRVYLNVPYAEKDAAKQLGAKWDAKAKRWFIAPELQYTSGESPSLIHRTYVYQSIQPIFYY